MILDNSFIFAILLLGICYHDCNGGSGSGLLPVVDGSLLPNGGPSFIHTTRGGSTRALDKDAITNRERKKLMDGEEDKDKERGPSPSTVNFTEPEHQLCTEELETDSDVDIDTSGSRELLGETLHVMKKDGSLEPLNEDKVRANFNQAS